jgi:hypothetical protein
MNITDSFRAASEVEEITVVVSTAQAITSFTMTHEQILADLNTLRPSLKGVTHQALILDAAIGHVESDRTTGTSLATWPEMRALVDEALTWALEIPHAHTVTTLWPLI